MTYLVAQRCHVDESILTRPLEHIFQVEVEDARGEAINRDALSGSLIVLALTLSAFFIILLIQIFVFTLEHLAQCLDMFLARFGLVAAYSLP